jgi:hypothetical protein
LWNKWHKKRRGWVDLNAVINIKNFEIIDYLMIDEHVNDSRESINIVRLIKNRISKLF